MVSIDVRKFNKDTRSEIERIRHNGIDVGSNWPVVYIINNKNEAYVGETVNAARRMEQHWQNTDRRCLTQVRIISDETFNKSSILDLESFLIKYMGADGKFVLQNGNNGIQDHQYYQRNEYQELFNDIWKELRKNGIVDNQLADIENSELFKYSPYKVLGSEQINSEKEILRALAEYGDSKIGANIVVRGGAGTGKTILAIYIIKLIADINYRLRKDSTEADELLNEYLDNFEDVIVSVENIRNIDKIGIVVPQKSLQKTLKEVFKSVKGLNAGMVLSPYEVVKDFDETKKPFDLLIVDEAHRLKCRYQGHLSTYGPFIKSNTILGLDQIQGTELDWIMMCSRNQILFRDELQTVRPCDIPGQDFLRIIDSYGKHSITSALSTQWRCSGGNDYIEYLKNIFACKQQEFCAIQNYDIKLYCDCDEMIRDIQQKERELGLCRVAAGFAWPWKAKKEKKGQVINDVKIQGHEYHWNRTDKNWITSDNAINEIGCIHTVQGYDLNYAGIIIGEDLKYNSKTNEIYADKSCYFDQQGKSGVAFIPGALLEYISNIYLTLLTRGIKGTYIYVCNDELREYFKKFFPVK